MKRAQERHGLPFFNTARGTADTALLVPPPFTFPGITARVFPLRASTNILREFYQNYLNVAPEICTFEPALPWVFLVVLDYGRMAAEAANLGWISQHEIFFSVPLGMRCCDSPEERPVFQSWVLNTPFIFVDNSSSLTTGREVYGWPKVLARLHPRLGKWLTDPCDPTRLLSLDIQGFGDRQTDLVRLLEINQRQDQNMSLAPLDIKAIDPLKRLSRWIRTSLSTGLDLTQFLVRAPLSGFAPDSPEVESEILFDSLRQLLGFYWNPGVDVVTHKQFRAAHDPSQICYESLVRSRLGVARYNRGGLLGLHNVLQGEITGGFRIRLHQHPAFPIVESLGLGVSRERKIDGRVVSILEPILPFWLSVDLSYGKGEAICWRMVRQPWYRKRTPVGRPLKRGLYNTFAGAGQQVWPNPYYFHSSYWRVFPLRARRDTLCKFVHRYLNVVDRYRFEAWGSYVYMIASTGRMFSKVKSAAWIDATQIAFVVPLLCYEGGVLKGVLATVPFWFCDNPVLTTTLREVQGVPAMDATIEMAPRFWLRKRLPMLKMQVDVFTELNEGLESEKRTLLKVLRRALSPRCDSPPLCDSDLGHLASLDIWSRLPLQMLTLKQFRDSNDPKRACYQSLVLEPWTFSEPRRFKPLKSGTMVKIFRYPSLPLVEILGLETDSIVPPKRAKGAIADVLCPDRPFRIEWTIDIGLAEVISRTAGFLPWHHDPRAVQTIPDFPPEAAPYVPELIARGPQALVRALVDQASGTSRRRTVAWERSEDA